MVPKPITDQWTSAPGATPSDVNRLTTAVQVELPAEYLDLLQHSNGGEGELAVRPGWFQLYGINFAAELWNDKFYRSEFPDYYFFGSNGGLESFALVLGGPNAGSVVAVDAIAGVESSYVVAGSFGEFTQYLGKPAPSEA